MAEFGENLKRIREEKGMTQQTLADYLFVTRQAVSRWEGGSRYPDLMTAKKMAQFLEVSLDQLLQDDDMKQYVEKNAILETSVAKRVQLVLLTLAFMCSMVVSILYLCNHFIVDSYIIESKSETAKCLLLTLVLGYGVYAALGDRLTPKIAMLVSGLYFGTAILTGIVGGIWLETGFTAGVLLGATVLNVVILIICITFFNSKKIISPIPLYITAVVYGVIGVISSLGGLMADIPMEIYRDVVILHLFTSLQALLLLGLLVFMAHTLHKKRKLLAR